MSLLMLQIFICNDLFEKWNPLSSLLYHFDEKMILKNLDTSYKRISVMDRF